MYSIKIVRGNIVNATTEAIVCSANNNLMPGQGSNKMVFYAAGDRLIEECGKHKYCETGSAIYTQGFNVAAKYIIHAVGPYWHGGYNNEAKDLASCYISIMKIAHSLKIKSLAIPSLCTGRGGYPLDEAIDIAVSSVTSYLQAHNLEMEIWFMCYDQESLLKYRMKSMNGVGDIEKYFGRNEIKINAKLTKEEQSLLKKKLFKKEIAPEQEQKALESVLKRVIKKKYADCIYLMPPKKKENISMKTVEKHGASGPFITIDCVEDFSYDKERMQIKIKPFSFVDTPEELESKKQYFVDDNADGIPDEFDPNSRSSYNTDQKIIKVLNVESLLSGANSDEAVMPEYIDIKDKDRNVEIKDITAEQDKTIHDALENSETLNVTVPEKLPEFDESTENVDLVHDAEENHEVFEVEDNGDTDVGYDITEDVAENVTDENQEQKNNTESTEETTDAETSPADKNASDEAKSDESVSKPNKSNQQNKNNSKNSNNNKYKKNKKDYRPNYKPNYKQYGKNHKKK